MLPIKWAHESKLCDFNEPSGRISWYDIMIWYHDMISWYDMINKNDGYSLIIYIIITNCGIEKKMVCETNYGFAKKWWLFNEDIYDYKE